MNTSAYLLAEFCNNLHQFTEERQALSLTSRDASQHISLLSVLLAQKGPYQML